MKKIAFLILVLWVGFAMNAEAALVEKMNSNKALTKFGRGVTNLVSSPGEFLAQIPKAMEQSPDYLTGCLVWLGRGTGYTLLRAGAGIYDLATFPFPGETNYGPIMKPETIFDKVIDTTIS